MLLSLASSLLLAGLAQAGPASSYGPQAVAQPARQVAASGLQCRTEYITLWDTKYEEREEQVCTTVYEKACETRTQRLCQPTTRQECHQEYEQQCATVYRNVCVQKYRTEYEPYTESECTTLYKQDCQYQWEGYGNDKVWAPIDGTCQNVPYDECHEVAKTHSKQVAYQDCNDVPEQKCVSVPKQVCVTVPDQVCTNEPLTECRDVPRQACHAEHKRFPVRVSRKEAKKVCDEGYSAPAHVAASGVIPARVQQAVIPARVQQAVIPARVQQAAIPARVQQGPSVTDLLGYGSPAVPSQQTQKLKADNDRIVFG